MLVKADDLDPITQDAVLVPAGNLSVEDLEAYLTEASPGFSWDRAPKSLIDEGRQQDYLTMYTIEIVQGYWPFLMEAPETEIEDIRYREVTDFRGLALLKLIQLLGLPVATLEP